MGCREPFHSVRPGSVGEPRLEKFHETLLHRVGGLPEGGTLFGRKLAHVRHEFGKLPLAAEKFHAGRFQFRFGRNMVQAFIELADQSIQLFKEIHGKALWQAALQARLNERYEKGVQSQALHPHGEKLPKKLHLVPRAARAAGCSEKETYASLDLASSTMAAKSAFSRTARSASILRLISTPASFRPLTRRE